MRQITPKTRALLDNEHHGIEPIMIVGIKWTDVLSFYADRDIVSPITPMSGRIISFEQLEAVTRLDSNGQSASISFTLDDTLGDIKHFIDNTNIHYTPVAVYQYFGGTSYEDMVLLFEGRLVSPIVWEDHTRTVKLTAITKQVSNQVGYALDEASVGIYHQDLISKPWPVCFGTPVHVPALRLQEIPVGTTTQAFGIPDPSINYQNQQLNLQKDKMPNIKPGVYNVYYDNGQPAIQDQDNDGYDDFLGISSGGSWGNIGVTQYVVKAEDTPQAQIGRETGKLSAVYQEQLKWFKKNNFVIGGYKFPQNQKVVIKIGEQLFQAVFKGEGVPPYPDAPCPVRLEPFYDQSPFGQLYQSQLDNGFLRMPVQKTGFSFFQAGSRVELMSALPGGYNYVASITPGIVKAVYAVRSYNGLKQLTPVPTNLYSVQTIELNPTPNSNRQPMVATVINLPRPLSTVSYYYNNRTQNIEDYLQYTNYRDTSVYPEARDLTNGLGSHIINNQDWEDDLYVTFQSDVGPHPINILIWLIQNYTPYAFDHVSFGHVYMRLENFPANFALLDRVPVDQLLNDIAFQCCCSIWLKQDVYYIKYLREDMQPISTITAEDIEQDSFRLTTTETEDLVTRYVVNWRSDYYTPNKQTVYTRNIDHYGVHSEETEFYIFNDFNIINKMATYWLIVKSNIWKRVECNVFLTKLEIETLDDVRLQLDLPYVINADFVDCRVESSVYDSDNNNIALSLWVPILLGTMNVYPYVLPADLSVTQVTPYYEPITSGSSGGFSMGKTLNPSSMPDYNASQPARGTVSFGNGNSDWRSDFLKHFAGYFAPPLAWNPDPFGNLSFTTDPIMADSIIAGDNASTYHQNRTALSGPATMEYANIPHWDYEYGMYIGEDARPENSIPNQIDRKPRIGAFPGLITGGSNGNYSAQIYVKGMGNAPISAAVRDINPETTEDVVGKYFTISAVFTNDDPNGPGGTIERYFDSSKGSGGGLWGQVQGGSGSTHTVTLYPKGPDGTSGDTVTVNIPMLEDSESIPVGTWISGITKHTNGGTTQYYYQPPVWLGGSL